VLEIPFITNLYRKAKEQYLLTGICITIIISFLSYIINPISIFYPGDPFIDILLGIILGVLFTIKSKTQYESPINLGIIVGIGGGILSATSIALFKFIYFMLNFNIIPYGLLIFQIFVDFVIAILIGLVIGSLIGFIYFRKQKLKKSE